MNDSQAIRQNDSDAPDTDGGMSEQEELWRRAEDNATPLSEKISHALFAATILFFYFFSSNETAPLILMFMWFISFSASRHRRQQSQIDALRELLRRTTSQR